MSVKKLGPKNWAARACWVDPDGKQHQPYKSGFTTKAAALAWEHEQIEQSQGISHTASENLATVKQLHNEYMSRLRTLGRSPKTLDFYENCAKRWLPDLGERRLATVAPADIQQLINSCTAAGLSAATVRGTYRAIRAEFKYAENLDEITKTPCRGIELPAETPHEAVICTPADVQALFSALREQSHPLYVPAVLCVFCALRRGEAVALRWQDVDFDTGIATIRANLINATGGSYLKTAKTRSSQSTIALPDDLVEYLRAARADRLANGMYVLGATDVSTVTPIDDLDPREFVSLTEKGSVFRPGALDSRLHTFQRAHGLRYHGYHDLRHTYGTLMAEAEVDLVTISKAMRHSSTNITANMYISNTTGIKKKATEHMGQILNLRPADTGAADAGKNC